MRRLFIAVDLSINIVEKLAILQHELEEQVGETFGTDVQLRTVEAPNIHITLKFLGDTPGDLVPRIRGIIDKLCEPLFPFEIECQGVGAFPGAARPRILWAGLDPKGTEVLGLLQQALERDLGELGVARDTRDFYPHITLARVRSRKSPNFEELLKPYENITFGKSYIRDLVLFESHLRPEGARYEVVQRFPLGSV